MTQKDAQAFFDRASYDPVLQARLRSVTSARLDDAIDEIIRIAKEFGFSFTAADYRATLPGGRPTLRDEEIRSTQATECPAGHLMDPVG